MNVIKDLAAKKAVPEGDERKSDGEDAPITKRELKCFLAVDLRHVKQKPWEG